jgi:hypothetical protein
MVPMKNLKRRLALCVLMCSTAAFAESFEQGLAYFQKERYAAAYGQFAAAANQGDADAARFALFMVRYGGLAFGSHWSASPDEYADWSALARSNSGRPPPKFEETPAPRASAGVKRVQGLRCQLREAVSWSSDC